MSAGVRKHYIDNLRWMALLVLVPYHAAMAWNVWDEPNYIFFERSRAISSVVVFFSPFFMPLLFVLAGISTKYALGKRTVGQYLSERAKKLLVPLAFGTLALMPVLSYLADKFNYSYSGGFFRHYAVFFTKFTDLTGADGGFSLGQFWFLLYLFVISALGAAIIALKNRSGRGAAETLPFWAVLLLGLPLPLLGELLSVGGKSLAEYLYLFLVGYFVFSNDETTDRAKRYAVFLLCAGLAASALDVYLFIWSDREYPLLNGAAKYTAEWLMMIALLGLAKRYLDFSGKISEYMKTRSFLFYIYHFVWVVALEYLLYPVLKENNAALYFCTAALSYILTFVCCEISIRIPFLCALTGVPVKRRKEIS